MNKGYLTRTESSAASFRKSPSRFSHKQSQLQCYPYAYPSSSLDLHCRSHSQCRRPTRLATPKNETVSTILERRTGLVLPTTVSPTLFRRPSLTGSHSAPSTMSAVMGTGCQSPLSYVNQHSLVGAGFLLPSLRQRVNASVVTAKVLKIIRMSRYGSLVHSQPHAKCTDLIYNSSKKNIAIVPVITKPNAIYRVIASGQLNGEPERMELHMQTQIDSVGRLKSSSAIFVVITVHC